MMIFVGIMTALLLIVTGYIYTCYYLNDIDLFSKNTDALKLTKNKIIYLVVVVISAITLLILFEFLYQLHWLSSVRLISLAMILFPIGAIDARTMKIPNKILLFASVLRILLFIPELFISAEMTLMNFKECLFAGLIFGVFFFIIALIFKNSIGMGDVKLFAIIGFYQGIWGGANSIFFSLLVSFVLSVCLLITKKKSRNDTISFGPSILIGTIIAIGMTGM